jgi:hypothetical protein
MQVTVTVPDELVAAALALAGRDPGRATVEAMALEAYRERRITAYQLRTMPGISSRFELDAFLKQHRVETYTPEDFEHDLANLSNTSNPSA